jgi:hypothetical protein
LRLFMAKNFKWVEVRNGNYKLVPNDDPRPEVNLPNKFKGGAPNIAFVPSWKKYETPMFIGDGHAQVNASEKFTAEREHAIRTDPKAARWEKSRVEWFNKQKHNWSKKEKERLRNEGL